MVASCPGLLGRPGLAGDLNFQVPEDLSGRALRHHGPHALLDRVPGRVRDLHMAGHLRRKVLQQIALRIGHLIQQAQLKYGAPVGQGRHVAGQLDIGISVGALSHGGTLRVPGGQVRRDLRDLDAGRPVQTEHRSVFADHLHTHVRRILQGILIRRQPVGHFGEEIVAGVLDPSQYV